LLLGLGGCQNSQSRNDPGDMSGAGTFSVQIGPYDVAAGSETTNCVTVRLPTTAAVDLTHIHMANTLGGHHLILYRLPATTESRTPLTCGAMEGIGHGDVPLVISQSAESTVTLPTGVAYQIPAGQMVKLELHFLNTHEVAKSVTGTVTFTV